MQYNFLFFLSLCLDAAYLIPYIWVLHMNHRFMESSAEKKSLQKPVGPMGINELKVGKGLESNIKKK